MELSFRWMLVKRDANPPMCQAGTERAPTFSSTSVCGQSSSLQTHSTARISMDMPCGTEAGRRLGGSLEDLAPSAECRYSQRG